MRKRFNKKQMYEYAREKGIKGPWQAVWSQFGGLFFTLFEGKLAVIKFSSSPYVYLKVGEEFILLGKEDGEDGEIILEYPEVFGRGYYVGEVELPTKMVLSEKKEGGVVGTVWRREKKTNGALGKLGFVPYREWTEWVGEKRKFQVDLSSYRRFEVRGREWEEIFNKWESKKKDIEEEFYYRVGLRYAEKFPPRRRLSPEEWREYCIILGQHFYWLERQREEKEVGELRKIVWGREEEDEIDLPWYGFSILTGDDSVIRGPLSLLGLLKFFAGDITGVLERYISKFSIPTPIL